MRVYLPSTLPALARVLAAGELGPAPLSAYAVTPLLRARHTNGDLEELEYAALTAAARASLRLLAADLAAAPRRVVLAADVPDPAIAHGVHDAVLAEEEFLAQVLINDVVPLGRIAAGHVDGPEAASDVRAALAALAAAAEGDEDAGFTVEAAQDHELLWYATQELAGIAG